MSNTSKGLAKKGSKFWMQAIVNTEMQNRLNSLIGEPLHWLSPIKGTHADYAEYELRQDYICNAVGITSKQEKKRIFSFWPNRQPQWDGIALSKDKKVLYLVEAKAHLSELNSKMAATSSDSKQLITDSMQNVFDRYYPGGDFCFWTDHYYQLGNRLTFLHKLNENLKENNLEVKLVLLNIVGDYTYKPTSEDEWKNHYKDVFTQMTGSNMAPAGVIVVNYPVEQLYPWVRPFK